MDSFRELNLFGAGFARRKRQAISWLAVVTFAVTSAVPVTPVQAQPIPVPDLATPEFQESNLTPYFREAEGTSSTTQWQSIIAAGVYTISAEWESQVDALIESEVGSVTAGDAFHSQDEYREYLRGQLEIQKAEAQAAWEQSALAAIAKERSAFLTARDPASSAGNHAPPTSSGGDVDEAYARWEQKIQEEANRASAELGAALQNLENDYLATLTELQNKEDEFQGTLAEIEAYEQAVRDAIATAVAGMEGLLQSNGMFYDSPGVYNESGEDFQEFVDQLKQDLTNGVPLADLVLTMTTELEAKVLEEEQIVDHYTTTKTGTESFTDLAQAVGDNHAIDWRASNDVVNAIAVFMDTGDEDAFLSTMSSLKGKTFTEVNGSVDMCGSSSGGHYQVAVFQLGPSRTGECYSSAGNGAFTFDAAPCIGAFGVGGCFHNLLSPRPDGWAEQNLNFSGSLTWFDETAEENEETHQAYVDALSPIALNWRNNLLGAIETWEAQKAAYEENYANFQAEAAAVRSSAKAAFEAGRDELVARRNAYSAYMHQIRRRGQAQWSALQKAAAEAEASGDPEAAARARDIARELQRRSERTLDRIHDHLITSGISQSAARAHLDDARGRLNNISTDFNREGGGVDASVLENLLGEFQRATTGVKNLSYASAQHERAVDARNDAIGQIAEQVRAQNGEISFLTNRARFEEEDRLAELGRLKEAAESGEDVGETEFYEAYDQAEYDRLREDLQRKLAEERKRHTDDSFEVVVDEQGRVTMKRKIGSGVAVGNGGDATERDSYDRVMTEQAVTILPPDAVRLVGGEDIFTNWDYADLGAQVGESYTEYQSYLGDKMQSVRDQLTAANEAARERERMFQDDVTQKVATAKLLKKLAESMLKGSSLAEAIQSHVQGQVSAAIGQALNLPPSFVSAVLGGADPADAAKQYVKGQIMSAIDEALGLPPGFASMFMAHQDAKKAAAKAKRMGAVTGAITAVGVIAAPFTGGASMAIAGAVNGALQSEGGLQGMLVSAVGSIANTYVSGLTGGAVNVGLSYDPKDGFGASVGVGFGGGGLSFAHTEHGGSTVGLGYSQGGMNAGISYNTENGFGAELGWSGGYGDLGISYNESEGLSGSFESDWLNVNYDRESGLSGELNVSGESGGLSGGLNLRYDEENGFSGDLSAGYGGFELGMQYDEHNGLSGSLGGYGVEVDYANGDWGVGVSVGSLAGALGFDLPIPEELDPKIGYRSGEGLSLGVSSEYGDISYSGEDGLTIGLNPINVGGATFRPGYNSRDGFSVEGSGYGLNGSFGPDGISLTGDVQQLGREFGVDLADIGGSGYGIDGTFDFMGGGFTGSVNGAGIPLNIDGNKIGTNFDGSYGGLDFGGGFDTENGFTGTVTGAGRELLDIDRGRARSPFLEAVGDQWNNLRDWAGNPRRWGEDPPLSEESPIGKIDDVGAVLGDATEQLGEDFTELFETPAVPEEPAGSIGGDGVSRGEVGEGGGGLWEWFFGGGGDDKQPAKDGETGVTTREAPEIADDGPVTLDDLMSDEEYEERTSFGYADLDDPGKRAVAFEAYRELLKKKGEWPESLDRSSAQPPYQIEWDAAKQKHVVCLGGGYENKDLCEPAETLLTNHYDAQELAKVQRYTENMNRRFDSLDDLADGIDQFPELQRGLRQYLNGSRNSLADLERAARSGDRDGMREAVTNLRAQEERFRTNQAVRIRQAMVQLNAQISESNRDLEYLRNNQDGAGPRTVTLDFKDGGFLVAPSTSQVGPNITVMINGRTRQIPKTSLNKWRYEASGVQATIDEVEGNVEIQTEQRDQLRLLLPAE